VTVGADGGAPDPDPGTTTVPKGGGLGFTPYGGIPGTPDDETGMSDTGAVMVTTPVVPNGTPGPGAIV
jgi:hypothetical protein